MNLHENREVFEEVLAAASLPVEQGGIGVRLAFLEKDYWVTRALRNLAESRFANQAVFKGGTSLSKACGVGYRFSEDIDIAITSDDGRSDNQTKTLVGGIGKAMSKGLEEVVSFANPYPYSKRRIGSLIRDFLLLRGRELTWKHVRCGNRCTSSLSIRMPLPM